MVTHQLVKLHIVGSNPSVAGRLIMFYLNIFIFMLFNINIINFFFNFNFKLCINYF
jgi:hypothetical protein